MDEEEECVCPAGIPAWVMTFADLMSLLMCFFVLLLSFSEMDALKFKRLAGELRNAFGIQTLINASDPPKGTSVIARHFSPAIPEPTPINEVRQKTSDITKSSLEVLCQDEVTQQEEQRGDTGNQTREIVVPQAAVEDKKTEAKVMELAAKLEQEIAKGQVEIETVGKKIIIRVPQKGVFSSGSAYIQDRFLPVLDKIRAVLVTIPGRIQVEGHTDDIPIAGGRFNSNWGLSTARAVAFAEELFIAPEMAEERFQVAGHAHLKPLVENTDAQSRARNRRVEIIVMRSQDMDDDNQPEFNPNMEQIEDALQTRPEDFELNPNEIF